MTLRSRRSGRQNDARSAFVASHSGLVREWNEDSCAVSGVDGRLTSWRGFLSSRNGWALIADGVGGHVAGETAGALAVEIIRPMMANLQSDHDIQLAVNAADAALFMAMDLRPELRGMGTTIAGVLLRREGVIAFNAGDSRIYQVVNGMLDQVSIDDATKGGALLQCLGGFQEPVPMLVHTRWINPEAALVICSDGLTEMLTDQMIAETLMSGTADPALALLNAALEAGGHDNVSVIVLDCPSQPAEQYAGLERLEVKI